MKIIYINGVIVPNDYAWYYRDWLGVDCTCPKDVLSAVDAANGEPVVVRINSPGGEISSGSEIYDMLYRYPGEVDIEITGQACSAASVIAMAGYCKMASTALMMVHCVSSSVEGNHNQMEHAAEVLKTADQALCTAYMNKSGMTMEAALDMMERETWLTAEQAMKRGLIDGILEKSEPPEPLEPMVAGLFRLPNEAQMAYAREAMTRGRTDAKITAAEARLRMMHMAGGAI